MARRRLDTEPALGPATSTLLRQVVERLPGDTVRIGYLILRLRRRSFGGLLIVLAVLALVPGISAFVGLAMLVPAAQIVAGFRAPLLPRFVRRRVVGVDRLGRVLDLALPWLERVERLVRPRWPALLAAPVPNLVGVLIAGLALVVALPLPFSNLPPAVAIVMMSLALLEGDGLLMLLGVAFSLLALAIGGAIAYVAGEAGLLFLSEYLSQPDGWQSAPPSPPASIVPEY